MIKNGTFTEGWTDMPPAPGFLINQQPRHWALSWQEPGELLYDEVLFKARGVPECVHKLASQLPPHEQLGQPNALILEGDTTYKIFHGATSFGATLSQTVTKLKPGQELVLTVPIQLHLQGATDPTSAESGVWVNGQGSWVSGQDMGDRQWYYHTVTFTVSEDGTADIGIRVKSKRRLPIDFFIDRVTLGKSATAPSDDSSGSGPHRLFQLISKRIRGLFTNLGLITESTEIDLALEPAETGGGGETASLKKGPAAMAAFPNGATLAQPPSDSSERVLGMDISYAQAKRVNFRKAAEMGVQYCFIRAGSGRTEKDDNFDHNFAEAGRAGMLRGIYYYLYPESKATVGEPEERSPEAQARRFISLLREEAELGAVVDIEEADLTPRDVSRFVAEFQENDPYKRPITIYTANWFWNSSRGFLGQAVEWTSRHPLWAAHYTSMSKPIEPGPAFKVAIPKPWDRYTFHQWTSLGGLITQQTKAGLDLDYFPGSLSDLYAWARTGSGQLSPANIIKKFVTAEYGLHLRTEGSTLSPILTLLPFGTAVESLHQGEWDKIRYQGQVGFAQSEHLSTLNPADTGPDNPFIFEVWPTDQKYITQYFGEKPDYYKALTDGYFPGHEGLDIKAAFGSPYYCVAPGTVTEVAVKEMGEPDAYGWYVVVTHRSGYSTLYARAAPDIPVKVGDNVKAGHILAYSGANRKPGEGHLHFNLLKKGHQTPGWPPFYLNPWPYLEKLYNTLEPPAENLTEGFLYASSMDIRDNNLALANLTLNMRQSADSGSRLLGKVPSGSVVRLLTTAEQNGYLLCEAVTDSVPVAVPA